MCIRDRYQSRQYDDFELYKQDIIIPAMLIKLRQWMGRGIRRESDSAVFTILDSRASLCGKYREEILNALPSMPVTDRLVDVADFIIRKKADVYKRQIYMCIFCFEYMHRYI